MKQHNVCSEQVELLAKTVARQNKQIGDLQDQLEQMQAQRTKHNMLVWGLDEQDDEDTVQVVKDFLKLQLEITKDIPLAAAYRRGKGTRHSALFTLKNFQDKFLIYKSLKNLKGKKNSAEMGYSVRDDLPEAMREKDRRNRQLMHKNRKKTYGKMNMKMKNSMLYVNNEQYKKLVPNLKQEDVLLLEEEEREIVQTANLVSPREHREKGNLFKVYAASISNIKEVQAIQKHLKIKHMDADHVVTTYHMEGSMPNLRDYDDNGEIGAGARMLGVIEQKSKTQVAVYLVRYHSQDLGMRSFDIITDLTEQALDLLDEPANYQTSKIAKSRYSVKTPKQRTRGRLLGNRGAFHNVTARRVETIQPNYQMQQVAMSSSTSPSYAQVAMQRK